MSKVAAVEFVETVGLWAEESMFIRLCQASNFCIVADKCTDVTTINSLPVEYANARESPYAE